MGVIPFFQPSGLLPPGDYEVSFAELRQSVLVLGPKDSGTWPNWDADWRGSLVNNLEILTRQLWEIGITEVFADGSFAEDKEHPNDIDGYFVCDLDRLKNGELARELNLRDPDKVWTWGSVITKAVSGLSEETASNVASLPRRDVSACARTRSGQRHPRPVRQ